uniref:Serpentine Receptor, class T n=1 Tax=Bursaphelenchus xylophilus TaxID=6326 RepID=A0A1I7RP45_BURXY
MDVFLTKFSSLSYIYNLISIPGCLLEGLFTLLVLFHTPKDMLIYKHTMLNTSVWSLLIIVHLTLFFRPVTFLPLPICAVTGLAQVFGRTFASCQFLVALFLIANKSISLFLCVAANYVSLTFPLYIRTMTYRKGIMIFSAFHSVVSLLMLLSAYMSYADREALNRHEIVNKLQMMYPYNYDDILSITNNSVVIGVRRNSLVSFSSGFFLFLSTLCIVLSLTLTFLSVKTLNRSMTRRPSHSFITLRRRLKIMLIERSIVPILTYSLPITIAVAIIHFDLIEVSGWIQWLILTSIASPLICNTIVMGTLEPFRKVMRKVLNLEWKVLFKENSSAKLQLKCHRKRRLLPMSLIVKINAIPSSAVIPSVL